MGRTPDRRAGPLFEEKIVLEQEDEFGNPTTAPTEEGGITYHDGQFSFRDELGVATWRDLATGKPFEVPFTNKRFVIVNHQRGQRALVQVISGFILFGWNLGGWNEPDVCWNIGGFLQKRLPDDQYETLHIGDDRFLVLFDVVRTGRVVYF